MKIYTKIVFDMNTMDVLEEESYEYEGEIAKCYEGSESDAADFGAGNLGGSDNQGQPPGFGNPTGDYGSSSSSISGWAQALLGVIDFGLAMALPGYAQAKAVVNNTLNAFGVNVTKADVAKALTSSGFAITPKGIAPANTVSNPAETTQSTLDSFDNNAQGGSNARGLQTEMIGSDPAVTGKYSQLLGGTSGTSGATTTAATPKTAQDVFNNMVDNFYGVGGKSYKTMLDEDAAYQRNFVEGSRMNITASGSPFFSFVPKQAYTEAEYTSPNRSGLSYQNALQELYGKASGNDPYVKPKSTSLADTLDLINTGTGILKNIYPYLKSNSGTQEGTTTYDPKSDAAWRYEDEIMGNSGSSDSTWQSEDSLMGNGSSNLIDFETDTSWQDELY
jgi:hypothetical protein